MPLSRPTNGQRDPEVHPPSHTIVHLSDIVRCHDTTADLPLAGLAVECPLLSQNREAGGYGIVPKAELAICLWHAELG